MRLLRFQQKPSENRIGIMVDSARFAELGTSKNSEPILEFLQDPKREAKANQTLEAAKKQIVDSGEKNPKGVFNLDKVTLLDYEVELAAVIGKRCRDISKKNALDHIAGFSVFNDISARDIQFAEMKRGFCNLGKNFASFAPMGPFLVTPDQAGNPDNLGMELRVNGQTRQFSSTKNMVFKIRQLVEFFSSMTLEPGDIITSGTPSGVAIYRKPDKTPFLLQPGDMIESKIENLGRLQNTVLAGTSPVRTPF